MTDGDHDRTRNDPDQELLDAVHGNPQALDDQGYPLVDTINVITIYRGAADYPDVEYVVRRFDVKHGGSVEASEVLGTGATLEEARAHVPDGLIVIPRSDEDDAVIVESWI